MADPISGVQDGVQCTIRFANGREVSLNDMLTRVTHIRGFNLGTSYCILETLHTSLAAMDEFSVHSEFTLEYSRANEKSPKTQMEIYRIDNGVTLGSVGTRVIGVEPGWLKMMEKTKVRSFQKQAISSIIAQLGKEAGLQTKIQSTSGTGTFIQTNVSDFQFIRQYLQPLATDSAGNAPYLFTIDNGILYFQLPLLNQKPAVTHSVTSTIDSVIKKWIVRSLESNMDMATGNQITTYGYDFQKKGPLKVKPTLQTTIRTSLNKKPMTSDFTRARITPYPQQWMLNASSKNELGRSQFSIEVDAIIDSYTMFNPGTLIHFLVNEELEGKPQEYSGRYYVYELCNSIMPNHFTAHMLLRSNALLKDQVAGD